MSTRRVRDPIPTGKGEHPVPRQTRHSQTTGPLRLLATTDLHMNLMSHDYFTDTPRPASGLVRTATLVERLRKQAPGAVLLVDNGDSLQGNPLSDWLAEPGNLAPEEPHPMIAAMQMLGYDAATIGNHEFNYGLEFLNRTLRHCGFPVVSANVTTRQAEDPAQDETLVPPHALIDRMIPCRDGVSRPIRIGIIGFAPPQITRWDAVILGDRIGTRDIVAAARAHLPALRAAGADIVVALCHSGIGADSHEDGMENAAVPLAALDGIDVIVTGHTHRVFPGEGHAPTLCVDPERGLLCGKPAVMPGSLGSHLGVIDLELAAAADGWRIESAEVSVQAIAEQTPDGVVVPRVDAHAGLANRLEGLHRRIVEVIRAPVGEVAVPLHSYFAKVGRDAGLQVVADAQRRHAAEVLAGRPEADLPLISAVAPFKLGGQGGPSFYVDIDPGPLSLRHASELYLYPNAFCILALPARALGDWMERTASGFRRIRRGVTDQPLLDPTFPPYVFDILDGLICEIDPTRPPRSDASGAILDPESRRVRGLRLVDRPLDPDETVLIATNSYRAGGGGGFDAALQGKLIHESTRSIRDIVVDHIRAGGPVAPVARNHWSFSPLPGTGAWFDTGPGALRHEAPPGVVPVGPAPGGFHRFSISF